MLFTSAVFFFLYLPTVFSGYYLLGRRAPTWAAAWLFVASVAFYGYWMPEFTLLLLASILWNYCPCLMSLIVSAHGQSIRPTPFVPIWQKPEENRRLALMIATGTPRQSVFYPHSSLRS